MQEANEALLHIRRLWPAWKPNETEITEWVRQLQRFESLQSAMDGISEAWRNNQYATPRCKAIIEAITLESQKAIPQDTWATVLHTGLATVGKMPSGRRGWYPVCVYPGDERMASESGRRAAAEVQLDAHRKLFGGTWEIMTEAEATESCRQAEPAEITYRLPKVLTRAMTGKRAVAMLKKSEDFGF